jgi:hypothetical protein
MSAIWRTRPQTLLGQHWSRTGAKVYNNVLASAIPRQLCFLGFVISWNTPVRMTWHRDHGRARLLRREFLIKVAISDYFASMSDVRLRICHSQCQALGPRRFYLMNAHFYPYSFGLRYHYIKSSCTANFPSQLHALTDFPGQCTTPVNARLLRKTSTPIPHI